MDVAEVVVDNCIQDSDAAIEIDHTGQRVSALSTVVGAYIIQRLVFEVALEYHEEGKIPPIFASANVPGGDAWNEELIQKYRNRIRAL